MPLTSSPPAPAHDLPAVLGLRPHHRVFRLGPGERFIGLDPATALVAEGLPEPLAAMLDDLADPVHRDDLVGRAVDRGADRTAALALLADLHRAGAVVDAATRRLRPRQRADATVLVHGDGPLAVG
ncbi:MAG TPA: hypothetical protein VEZ42_18755, partial [Pseudonocardia sp.]|nr:hypothetical protein [Pseudonocardia sp.]